MSEKRLLAGYSFDENGPFLKLDTVGPNPTREQQHLRGKTLTIRKLNPRRCVGRYNLQTFGDSPCPDSSPLKASSNICHRCFTAIGFNPAFYNAPPDQLSPQQRRYNEEPHSVYLANFQREQTKVGISNKRRAETRLLEQGARSALIVLECQDANEARVAETAIGKELGLSETARKTTKRRWINERYDPDRARNELMGHRLDVGRQMGLSVLRNDVICLDDHYLGGKGLTLPIQDVSDNDPLIISGHIVGMIGEVLIVEQLQQFFMISISKMVSHIIEMSDEVIPQKAEPMQLGLF